MSYAVYFGVLVLLLSIFFWNRASQNGVPPGPKPRFLLGNIFDVPTSRPWLTYAKWREQYGDVVSMNVLGRSLIVLNSYKACIDLLERRSAKYSGRPYSVMLHDLMGWRFAFSLMGYTPQWRAHRKLFHQHFSENVVGQHRPAQERNTHALLRRLLTKPEDFHNHLRLASAAIILDVLYAVKVEDHDNIFVTTAERAMEGGAAASNRAGSFLVDIIPIFRHIPSWVPGAGFQTKAAMLKAINHDLRFLPLEDVQRRMAQGKAGHSVLARMLDMTSEEKAKFAYDGGEAEPFETMAADASAVGYAAGAHTTLAAIDTFLLAMVKYPEVQQTAQAEISKITGDTRLPTFDDIQDAPYINAVIKELLRWNSVTPLGLPHALSEDDAYNGYFLPKGSIVMPNIWAILHDSEMYPEPMEFKPSRWLIHTPDGLQPNLDILDSSHAAFGFGRRICSGRYFAEDSLFIIISSVLACFDIKPALDGEGNPIAVEAEFTDAAISNPMPYKARILPRSINAARLVHDTEMSNE